MKFYNNTSGIAPLVIILAITIVGVSAFAGYRIFDSNKSNSKPTEVPVNSETVKLPEVKSGIADGFDEYKNDKLGFRFVYPIEWGEPQYSLKYRNYGNTESSKTHFVTFTNKKDTGVKISKSDWEWTGGGREIDAPVNSDGFRNAAEYFSESGTEVVKSDDAYAYVHWEGLSGSVNISGVKKISPSNLQADFVEFYGPTLDGESQKVEDCTTEFEDGRRATTGCYEQKFIEHFKELISSFNSI